MGKVIRHLVTDKLTGSSSSSDMEVITLPITRHAVLIIEDSLSTIVIEEVFNESDTGCIGISKQRADISTSIIGAIDIFQASQSVVIHLDISLELTIVDIYFVSLQFIR